MSLTGAGFSATFYIQAASYAGIVAGGWLADHYSSSSGRSRVLTQSLGLAIGAPFLFLIGVTTSHALLIGGSLLLFRMRIEQPACSEASAAPLR